VDVTRALARMLDASWIVIAWCGAAAIATLLNPAMVARVATGVLAASSDSARD
jgi:hypothetical protein